MPGSHVTKRVQFVLGLLAAVAAFVWAFRGVDLPALVRALRAAQPGWLVLATGALAVTCLILAIAYSTTLKVAQERDARLMTELQLDTFRLAHELLDPVASSIRVVSSSGDSAAAFPA